MLEKLRALNIGNQIIDREDCEPDRRGLVQRLRDLLDDIERAERVIQLWTNGRRPSAEEVQNLIYVSFRDPAAAQGQRQRVGDLHLKAAKKFTSPKTPADLGGPAGDQGRRGRGPTPAPTRSSGS